MKTYYAVGTQLHVSKSTPAKLVKLLDYLYCVETPAVAAELKLVAGSEHNLIKDTGALVSLLSNATTLFDAWNWQHKEDKGDHWLYQSRAGVSSPNFNEFMELFDEIRQYLIFKDGDILLRAVADGSSVEHILSIYREQLIGGQGFEYDYRDGKIKDNRHPKNIYCDRLTPSNIREALAHGELPWTINALLMKNAVERLRRQERAA